jgi:hypothetical protein
MPKCSKCNSDKVACDLRFFGVGNSDGHILVGKYVANQKGFWTFNSAPHASAWIAPEVCTDCGNVEFRVFSQRGDLKDLLQRGPVEKKVNVIREVLKLAILTILGKCAVAGNFYLLLKFA